MDRLRAACADALSLVALEDEMVVGHILFTPAIIENAGRRVTGMGLVPLAVRPDHQGRGIGSALVRQGLAMLREQGCPFVTPAPAPVGQPQVQVLSPAIRGTTRVSASSTPRCTA